MNQNQSRLGQLPGEHERRDAIHIAIAPVIAAEMLQPGEHVGPLVTGRFCGVSDPIGIVDPFLSDPVEEGQTFWLLLYPGTITSLRHSWTHPYFVPRAPEVRS